MLHPYSLAKAIACWLEFHSICGVSGAITEYQMAMPLHMVITSKGRGCWVKREQPLGEMMRTGCIGKSGRPKAFDFCVYKIRDRQGPTCPVAVIETKYAGKRLLGWAKLKADIQRLASVKGVTVRSRWLIVAGRYAGNGGSGVAKVAQQIKDRSPELGKRCTVKLAAMYPRELGVQSGGGSDGLRQITRPQDIACAIWEIVPR